MDSQGELHPNWRALATIHLPLKRFLPEGMNDMETGIVDKTGQKYEIQNINGEEAKSYYDETIQRTEKRDEFHNKNDNKKKTKQPICPQVVEESQKPFNQKNYFRYAMENNVQGLKEFEYTVNELNSCDSYGWTALMMAACEGAEKAVRLLLRLGVKKELCDKSGKTALDIARSKGYWTIAKLLENFSNTEEYQQIIKQQPPQPSYAASLPVEPFYCEVCKRDFKDSNYSRHLTSTVHQFNERNTNAVNKLNKFNIPPKNRGLQLMVKQGWDKESGLGPTSSGRLYPVKTVIRKQRTGLGIEQTPARVTHFEAFDLRATKSDYYKKKQRNRNDIRREKQRDWKRERRLRTELS